MEEFLYALRAGYLNESQSVDGEVVKDSFYRCQLFGNHVYAFIMSTYTGAMPSLGVEQYQRGDAELDTFVTGATSL
jgi:hypothetical protein